MQGILFSQMTPPPGWEGEFHDWYNTEHIPVRLALDGFRAARRFEGLGETRDYLAVYELSDLGVFGTPAFRSLKEQPSERTARMLANVTGFTRYVCEQIADSGARRTGAVLSVNAFRVPPEDETEFNDWYDSEHTPRLLQGEGWLRVRRYKVIDADDELSTHFALHELASAEAMNTPERAHARSGPKRDALTRHDWYRQGRRWLYRTIFCAPRGGSIDAYP